ncbi:hypothetical protein PFRI_13200 [Planktotalea frisia]|uniref:Uncharacterized protein n=1 Tax=Planktotalea frisia TaxID=696762 RepID=A0A1L9NYU3_9RHOB|nr:hypothetical protein PFRI_13200 [Planktotalea frisia]
MRSEHQLTKTLEMPVLKAGSRAQLAEDPRLIGEVGNPNDARITMTWFILDRSVKPESFPSEMYVDAIESER